MDAATPIQAPLSRTYSPKQHYRVVFKELCESLHDVKDVQDVGTALGGAVFGKPIVSDEMKCWYLTRLSRTLCSSPIDVSSWLDPS